MVLSTDYGDIQYYWDFLAVRQLADLHHGGVRLQSIGIGQPQILDS